ncbi:MAG: formate/nitrite transporter family protein [Dehalococcoidia bacterium]
MPSRQDPGSSVDLLVPQDVARACEAAGLRKASLPAPKLYMLAVLAGAFIALGAMFFTVVTTGSVGGFGPTRMLGGLAFSLGLILVVLAGAELFTGNTMMVMAVAARRLSVGNMLRTWAIVYAGNFTGAIATAVLVRLSGHWEQGQAAVGGNAIRVAVLKADLSWTEALLLGVLCNALVALAIWLSLSARSFEGKLLAIIFPVTAFITAGFENSIANMYFIPMGIMLRGEPSAVEASGLPAATVAELSWLDFAANLMPVTVGNILGGTVLIWGVYWVIYLWRADDRA